MEKELKLECAKCPKKLCFLGFHDKGPDFCPMKVSLEVIEEARKELQKPETSKMAKAVALTWKESKMSLTRIEETMIFARQMGYKKLGIAFCIGLSEEAELLTYIFENHGFEVVSACCVAGGFSSDDIGLPKEDRVMVVKGFKGDHQPQCNPVLQAMLLNRQKTDLNVLLGLCTGDDTIFIKYSEAPVTVLAVKDRVLGHNPLAAIYTSKRFYTRLNARKPKK